MRATEAGLVCRVAGPRGGQLMSCRNSWMDGITRFPCFVLMKKIRVAWCSDARYWKSTTDAIDRGVKNGDFISLNSL